MWLFWRKWKDRTYFSTQSEIWGWEKVTDSNHFSKMDIIDILKKKWMLSVQSSIFWNITRVLRPTVGCVGLPAARPHMPQKDTFAGYLSLPLKWEHPIWIPWSDLLIYFLQRFLWYHLSFFFPVVSGSKMPESKCTGLRRSGWFHQRGECHAFTEPPKPHPPVRHRPHTAYEDGNPWDTRTLIRGSLSSFWEFDLFPTVDIL